MQETAIEWTDYSANPIKYRDAAGKSVHACIKCSPGCAHCYSEAIAHRYKRGGPFSLQVTKKVTPYFDEKEAREILRSKKLSGKKVFIGDMTDIFGSWVPFELLDQLFAVFALRPDVTFQVLTKRTDRMAEYFTGRDRRRFIADAAWVMQHAPDIDVDCSDSPDIEWPLPNVWLGTSVEDQPRADERVELLRQCPAAVRFLSIEPMLEHIKFRSLESIHLCIVGGESGSGARPFDVEWARSIISQCKDAGVACFNKQLGGNAFDGRMKGTHPNTSGSNEKAAKLGWPDATRFEVDRQPTTRGNLSLTGRVKLTDSKGGDDMSEWPADLRVREFPKAVI